MAEKELNGVRMEKFQAILDAMQDDPKVLQAVTGPWKSRVVWQGGLKAKAYMRKHAVEMDEPEGLEKLKARVARDQRSFYAISSVTRTGVSELVNAAARALDEIKADETQTVRLENSAIRRSA